MKKERTESLHVREQSGNRDKEEDSVEGRDRG